MTNYRNRPDAWWETCLWWFGAAGFICVFVYSILGGVG